jgi:hypothetical protein
MLHASEQPPQFSGRVGPDEQVGETPELVSLLVA